MALSFRKILLLTLLVFFASPARADERHLSRSELKRLGFQLFSKTHPLTKGGDRFRRFRPGSLPWPVQFHDATQTISQNYVQYQNYGDGQYFHKGCDLRAEPGSWVTAPVTGILEAGYYSYQTNEDGSETKFWKPWSGKPHTDPYFELALVTPEGLRFELHHVDSMNLPAFTIEALRKGSQTIQAGTQIGHVFPWGRDYDHIHYNVFAPNGTILNPEFLSTLVRDTEAPKLLGLFAVAADGKLSPVREGETLPGPVREFVLIATESKDQSRFVQTPPYAAVRYESGQRSGWDFRERLLGFDGKWTDIRAVFQPMLRLPNGRTVRNEGNYGKGQFILRIPNPPGAQGRFVVEAGDVAGNISRISATLGARR